MKVSKSTISRVLNDSAPVSKRARYYEERFSQYSALWKLLNRGARR